MSVVTPNQILEAIAHFTANGGDPHAAFRITLGGDKPRTNKSGSVAYLGWEVNVLVGAVREWRKVCIRVANLDACSSAKPNFGKVCIMFRVGSKYVVNSVEQRIGEAVFAMNAAFEHHMEAAIKAKRVIPKSKLVRSFLQTEVGEEKKPLTKAEYMFRVEIKFPQEAMKDDKPAARGQQSQREPPKPDAIPVISVKDASKKKMVDGKADFELARIGGKQLTYETLQNFITTGSGISGVIDASEITMSSMGCALGMNWSLLIVKHVKGGREVSTSDGLGDFADAIDGGGDSVEPDDGTVAPAATPAAAAAAITSADLNLTPPEDDDDAADDAADDADADEAEDEDDDEDETPPPVVAAPPPAAAKRKPAAKKP